MVKQAFLLEPTTIPGVRTSETNLTVDTLGKTSVMTLDADRGLSISCHTGDGKPVNAFIPNSNIKCCILA